MARVDPNKMMFLADRNTYNRQVKKINGNRVRLVSIQESRRNKRTSYIYHVENTKIIIFNQSRHGVYFMRIALRRKDAERYYDIFVNPPLTHDERVWLTHNDYVLL
jgi:Zn/Cd-binding protein ZinT